MPDTTDRTIIDQIGRGNYLAISVGPVMSALADLAALVDTQATTQTISAQQLGALLAEWSMTLRWIDRPAMQADAATIYATARNLYRLRYYPEDYSHA